MKEEGGKGDRGREDGKLKDGFQSAVCTLTVCWLVKHRALIIQVHNANGDWSRDTSSRGAAIVQYRQQQVGVIMALLIVKGNPNPVQIMQ